MEGFYRKKSGAKELLIKDIKDYFGAGTSPPWGKRMEAFSSCLSPLLWEVGETMREWRGPM